VKTADAAFAGSQTLSPFGRMAYVSEHRFIHASDDAYDSKGAPTKDHVAAAASHIANGMFVQSIRERRYQCPAEATEAYHAWTADENLSITGGAMTWPRCDMLVEAAACGDLVTVRYLLGVGVPVIATDKHMSTALLEASCVDNIDPSGDISDAQVAQNRLGVMQELLEWGFPPSFGGGGPSVLCNAMLGANVQVVSLLLKYGDGREFEGEIGKHLLDNARGYASGEGPFARNIVTPAARLVMAAAERCHPGKIRHAMRRLRRLAPLVGRIRAFLLALYTEVHYRPGGEGEQAAKNSFDVCLNQRGAD